MIIKMHFGELYRMELAYNLEHIGYKLDFQKDKANRWTFEIKGVPKEDIETFSKRREKILEVADELRLHNSGSLALIAKSTRNEKINCNREDLQKAWEERAIDLKGLKNLSYAQEVSKVVKQDIEHVLTLSIQHLSEREAVFNKDAIIENILQDNKSDFNIEQIENGISRLTAQGKLLKRYEGERNSFTTPANLKLERDVIKLMQGFLDVVKPIITKKKINENLSEKNLTIGQKDAVYIVLNSADGVIGVQGSAGVWKTTVLKTINERLKTKGYELFGIAPTKSAANTITNEVGIKSMTAHLFIAKYAGVLAGRGTTKGRDIMKAGFANKIVVLDEAGLASSEQMKNLLTLSKELKFRFLMLGDVKQLGAVEAGKPFYYLQNHGLNTVSMNIIKRQENNKLLRSVVRAENSVDLARERANKLISQSLKEAWS